jgi:hypothetical protein
VVADEARERGRTALLEGYLQGACGRDLIRRRAGSCGAGKKVRHEAVWRITALRRARRGLNDGGEMER